MITMHNIVDVSPLYHRFAYRMRLREANSDIPIMYFVLREIEYMRQFAEERGAKVVTSACFDSGGNLRKEVFADSASGAYKSGRTSILTDQDIEDIEKMKDIMTSAGINVFSRKGCEADDIIYHLANINTGYDLSVIYTTDKDMMINISGSVGMRRYTSNGSWSSIAESNFVEETSRIFGVNMTQNAIGLYLCTVGDSADKISGIKGFGKKAFDKFMQEIKGICDWKEMKNYDRLAELLVQLNKKGLLEDEKFRQAVQSYHMVRNIEIVDGKNEGYRLIDLPGGMKKIQVEMEIPTVMKMETKESRVEAYMKAGMKSLAK